GPAGLLCLHGNQDRAATGRWPIAGHLDIDGAVALLRTLQRHRPCHGDDGGVFEGSDQLITFRRRCPNEPHGREGASEQKTTTTHRRQPSNAPSRRRWDQEVTNATSTRLGFAVAACLASPLGTGWICRVMRPPACGTLP